MMPVVRDSVSVPRGYRFLPTPEELIGFLIQKIQKKSDGDFPLYKIKDVYIYEHHPDQLAEIYGERDQTEAIYFFNSSRPNDKNCNGKRTNRAVLGTLGKWRATGGEDCILAGGYTIGYVRALQFLEGTKGKSSKKTKWLMQEYYLRSPKTTVGRLHDSTKLDDHLVLCKIYETNRETKEQDIPSSSRLPSMDQVHVHAPINGFGGGNYYHMSSNAPNYALADPSFNNTRADDHVVAAQVPGLAMNYDPNYVFVQSGLQQSGFVSNAPLGYGPYGNPNFGGINHDALIFDNARPSGFADREPNQPFSMSGASNDQNTRDFENTGDMFLQNNITEHHECPNLPNDRFSFVESFEDPTDYPEFQFYMNPEHAQ